MASPLSETGNNAKLVEDGGDDDEDIDEDNGMVKMSTATMMKMKFEKGTFSFRFHDDNVSYDRS